MGIRGIQRGTRGLQNLIEVGETREFDVFYSQTPPYRCGICDIKTIGTMGTYMGHLWDIWDISRRYTIWGVYGVYGVYPVGKILFIKERRKKNWI